MSIASAKKTLLRAKKEILEAKDEEGRRQAAEKAWRAAREAVYAVMAVVDQKPKESTLGGPAIAKFEMKFLGRGRGGRHQPLTDGYVRAIHTLHGVCFYDAICPKQDEMMEEFERVASLIDQAEQDEVFLRSQNRRRSK